MKNPSLLQMDPARDLQVNIKLTSTVPSCAHGRFFRISKKVFIVNPIKIGIFPEFPCISSMKFFEILNSGLAVNHHFIIVTHSTIICYGVFDAKMRKHIFEWRHWRAKTQIFEPRVVESKNITHLIRLLKASSNPRISGFVRTRDL